MQVINRGQARELKRLQVTPEQLAELRRILPNCKSFIEGPSATMTEVRDELADLHKALLAASTHLHRWESARFSTPALSEARARIHEAAFDLDESGTAMPDADDAIRLALQVVAQAQARLPKEARRPRASHFPIHWINEALLRGWGHTHYSMGSRDGSKGVADRPVPPYPHHPSSGATSSFRQIVSICYDAALGTRDNDPERAIREFIRLRKLRAKLGRQVA